MQYLEVVDGQGRRRRVSLDRPRLLIGREPTCDIHLPHPGVSRRHAQLQRTDQGRWLLQDLRSRNHVFVDNKEVQQLVLEPRQPFRIADYWLMLQDVPPLPEPEVPVPILDDTDPGSTSGTSSQEPGWLEQLQVFQRSLFHQEEPRAVLERLVREVRKIVRPQLIAIGLVQPDGYRWELVARDEGASGLDFDPDGIDRRVTDPDSSSIQTWTDRPKGEDTPSPSPPLCLLFPMRGRSGVIGHVYLRQPSVTPVPKPMMRYLSLLSAMAGLAWDNQQLGALRLAQKEIEKELNQARMIQTDLFPPTFEVDARLDVFAVNLPSAYVSGDYYDLIRTGPHTVAFVIADAMGHGMPAALLMAAVRSALRMGFSLGLPWVQVFRGLDEVISQARGDMFVTGIVGHLDLRDRWVDLVCAGHPLPSVLVDGKPVVVPEHCQTRPWGLDLDTNWDVGRLSLQGEHFSILGYTDGVTDAAVRAQRAFGARRVAAYHQQHYRRSAEDLCEGLMTEVAMNPGATSLGDDQTVLVLRSV
ncbi:MAG: SpoIIE family protein phosphatase [Gemmataceae bacterium]|nr:SpoIIE family protein phosphatase [Gemmataceae bacterium]